jgi:hypothetical protein
LAAVDHRTTAELEAALDDIRRSPADDGVVELVVARPAPGERRLLDEAELDLTVGLVGDNWLARGNRHRTDGSADPEAQLTIMNSRVSRLVAIDPDRRPLAGDQLHVDFDISVDNLPPGSRLALGTAVVEISASPHTGCAKFVERFGREAMRFVNSPLGRQLRLRGVNTRVVVPGTVRPGDAVRKVTAPALVVP